MLKITYQIFSYGVKLVTQYTYTFIKKKKKRSLALWLEGIYNNYINLLDVIKAEQTDQSDKPIQPASSLLINLRRNKVTNWPGLGLFLQVI